MLRLFKDWSYNCAETNQSIWTSNSIDWFLEDKSFGLSWVKMLQGWRPDMWKLEKLNSLFQAELHQNEVVLSSKVQCKAIKNPFQKTDI